MLNRTTSYIYLIGYCSVSGQVRAARILNSKAVILSLERLLKALKTNDLFNFSRLNLKPHLIYELKSLQNLQAHVYIGPWGVWSPAGGYRASQMPKTSKTSKTLKPKVDKTVDTFHPLTVNRLLGRLVNTLGNKVIGAVAQRWTHPLRQLKSPKALQPLLALVSWETDEEQY